MPPNPNRRPWRLAAAATRSTIPRASGSNMNRWPSDRCRSLRPTYTSARPGVAIQSSRHASAAPVSSSGTIGTRPATRAAKSRNCCACVNMGSINRSAPCASTASTSAAVAALGGLTRTIKGERRSTCLMRPTSSRLWTLMKVLRPACRSALPSRSRSTKSRKPPSASQRRANAGSFEIWISSSMGSRAIIAPGLRADRRFPTR